MNTTLKILFTIIIIFFYNYIFSQDCSDYYKKCTSATKSFETSGMSRGIKISKGSVYELNINLYANRNYFISIKGDKELGDIQIIILDIDNQVIYNNSVDEFKSFTTISTNITMPIKIQIITQPDVYKEDDKINYCAGIFIAYQKIQ